MQSITALPIRQHVCCAIQQSSCRWLYRVNNWRSLCDCCTQNCRAAWREWVSAAERKLSRLCAPLWPGIRDTRRKKKKPLSLWGNRTSEQRGALVPLLRYLLNSNTPGDDPTRRERDGGSSWCDPHSLTATSARGWAGGAAEWWVEHQQGIEEASAAPSSGWWYITVCTAASIHPSPYHSSSARSFIKITSKMGEPRVCFVGKRDGISSDPVGLLAAGSRRWLHQQRLDADIFFTFLFRFSGPDFPSVQPGDVNPVCWILQDEVLEIAHLLGYIFYHGIYPAHAYNLITCKHHHIPTGFSQIVLFLRLVKCRRLCSMSGKKSAPVLSRQHKSTW